MNRISVSTWMVGGLLILAASHAYGDTAALEADVRRRADAAEEKLIQWRRDIHQHPELGDQEKRTAKLVADHLKTLGLDVRTGVARTGVVGILKGGKPGRTVALRADMDALPVQEPPGLPFASKERGKFHGEDMPLMHACGHDAHTAILMATAEVLAGMRSELPGTVMFLFQPAEEGSSLHDAFSGKSWGAKLMMEEGVFKDLKPEAVFGLHVMVGPAGKIMYREGPMMASSDNFDVTVQGRPGHGGMPWDTVDPITTASLAITGLQTVVSRKADLTASPVVVSVGSINGGTGPNIVPESVHMTGTIRTFDEPVRDQVHGDIKRVMTGIADSAGAKADVTIGRMYDVTINNPALTQRMLPALKRASDGQLAEGPMTGASEDFSVFANAVPGLYVGLGVTPRDQDPTKAAPNHHPRFYVDESALVVGARTLATLAVDFLAAESAKEVAH